MTTSLQRLLWAAALALPVAVHAHVVLQDRTAIAGASYKAVFTITHGCSGSPVHTVTVRIPAGFRGAKPLPKPGWTLQVTQAPLAEPYTSHGKPVTEGTTEIRWTALSPAAWVQDTWVDEFALRGQTPSAAGPLWFAVRQDCERGQIDWAERPHHGTSTQGLKEPAVLLEVLPAPVPPVPPAVPAHVH